MSNCAKRVYDRLLANNVLIREIGKIEQKLPRNRLFLCAFVILLNWIHFILILSSSFSVIGNIFIFVSYVRAHDALGSHCFTACYFYNKQRKKTINKSSRLNKKQTKNAFLIVWEGKCSWILHSILVECSAVLLLAFI